MALSWYERTSFPLFFLCLFFCFAMLLLLCRLFCMLQFIWYYLLYLSHQLFFFYTLPLSLFFSYKFLSFGRSQPSTLFPHHHLNFLFPPLLPILWCCLLAIIRLFLRNISSLFPSFLFLLSPSPSLDHPIISVSLNFFAFLVDRHYFYLCFLITNLLTLSFICSFPSLSPSLYRPLSNRDLLNYLNYFNFLFSRNKKYRQALASGSADMTVKIWDVTTQACQHTFTHHKDKVQSVVWHYDEAWLLASGAFDQTIALLDCRTGNVRTTLFVPCPIISTT